MVLSHAGWTKLNQQPADVSEIWASPQVVLQLLLAVLCMAWVFFAAVLGALVRWSPWWKSQIGPERAILTILGFRPWLDFNFFLKTHCPMLFPVVLVLVKGFRFWCHPWVSFGESRRTLLDFGKFTLRFPRLGRQNAETHLLYASA